MVRQSKQGFGMQHRKTTINGTNKIITTYHFKNQINFMSRKTFFMRVELNPLDMKVDQNEALKKKRRDCGEVC